MPARKKRKGSSGSATSTEARELPQLACEENAALFDYRCLSAPRGKYKNMERPSRLLAAIHVLRLFKQHFGNQFSLISGVADDSNIMEQLLLAHSVEYVEGIRTLSASLVGEAPERLTGGDEEETMISEHTWAAATAAVSIVCQAIDLVRTTKARRVFCAVRPPGHHAGIKGGTIDRLNDRLDVSSNTNLLLQVGPRMKARSPTASVYSTMLPLALCTLRSKGFDESLSSTLMSTLGTVQRRSWVRVIVRDRFNLLTHPLSPTHPPTHPHPHTHTHTPTPPHAHTHIHPHSHTPTHSHSPTHSLCREGTGRSCAGCRLFVRICTCV
jgi:hypothetical protein